MEREAARSATSPVKIPSATKRRRLFDAELRKALTKGRFELHYQPIVDLSTRRWVGAEALCRWWRADGRLALPAEFIPAAEQSGLIIDLGAWVIGQATNDQLALRSLGLTNEFYFGINIAIPQLAEWKTLSSAMATSTGLGVNLRLEVTEQTFDPDTADLADRLRTLVGAGASAAIDDFGSGQSPVFSLGQAPVSSIKIDPSCTAKVIEPNGFERLGRIAATAREQGLEAIVEGVENEEQLKLLISLGFTLGQGFLLARPLVLQEFTEALRASDALPNAPKGASLLKSA